MLGPTWESPELTSLNRLMPRSPLFPFPDAAAACQGQPTNSPWVQCLDGYWCFELFPSPRDLPDNLLNQDYKPSSAGVMPVPGTWEFNGVGQPHYSNVIMPFPEEAPAVPSRNPTGVYQTTFNLDPSWVERRTVLHFDGAQGVLQVYVNGTAVGLAKDAMTASAFDITPYVQPGNNTLCCVLIKWSDASIIEDQDQWWTTGIHRSVYLYSSAPVYLRDVQAKALYDPVDRTGQLALIVPVYLGRTPLEGYTLRVILKGKDAKQPLLDREVKVAEHTGTHAFWPRLGARLNEALGPVVPWSAESPTCYTLTVELIDPANTLIEAVACRIGFRKIEIKNRQLLINGRPVMIKGVNRHESDPITGKVMTEQRLREDLLLLKRYHFNAIRTSHYPNCPRFYELCDELGFYVWDEANVESHATHNDTCCDPRYAAAFLERGMNMVLRDKNHPCIIAWSLGNESGYGANHDGMGGWIRGYDETRALHYEGAISKGQSQRTWQDGRRVTDIIGPMYSPIEELIEWSTAPTDDPRPMILCEYSHAMGNSNGSLVDYWAAFERYEGLQGGFIWEFCDHGIPIGKHRDRTVYGYGGDFGDKPNDANFCCDGLVASDRTPHPGMEELRKLQQPVAITWQSQTQALAITSKQDFTALDDLQGIWRLFHQGNLIEEGKLPTFILAPGEAVDIPLALPEMSGREGEWLLDIRLLTSKERPGLPAGHCYAWEQCLLREAFSPRPPAGDRVTFTPVANGFRYGAFLIDGKTGVLSTIENEGTAILESPLLPYTWRAPTDNDGIKWFSEQHYKDIGIWRKAGYETPDIIHDTPELNNEGTLTSVSRIACGDEGTELIYTQTFQPLADGSLLIDNQLVFAEPLPDLPRIGHRLILGKGFKQLRWYGRGPEESYADRKAGYPLGIYESAVEAQYVDYVMPQEHGNHEDTRWVEVSDGQTVFRVEAIEQPLAFNASHYSAEALTVARHTHDLTPENKTYLHLDHAQCGVGSGSCGPRTRKEYRLSPGNYRWSYRIMVKTTSS